MKNFDERNAYVPDVLFHKQPYPIYFTIRLKNKHLKTLFYI